MWNSFMKLERLNKAIAYRGLKPKKLDIDVFLGTLRKRGITDNKLNGIVGGILSVLEPPVCQMSHCKHYGGQFAFCNCSKGEIPGKCKIHREYLKRRKERGVKDVDFLLAAMDKKFKIDAFAGISIEEIKSYKFWEKVTEVKALSFLKKWNYYRFEEVKRLLLIRKSKEV